MRIQLTLLVSCTSQIEYTELLLVNVFNFISERQIEQFNNLAPDYIGLAKWYMENNFSTKVLFVQNLR